MLILFKNNTLIAGLRGADLTSNKRWFQREQRPWELLSCTLPFSAPQKQQIRREVSPSEQLKAAVLGLCCRQLLWSLLTPFSQSWWLPVLPTDPSAVPHCLPNTTDTDFPCSPIKKCLLFCFFFFLPHLSFILKFSLCCFLKACVTKAAFHPTFGLPEMFQSCFHVQKWKLPNPAQRKHASSSSVRKK